MRAIQEIICNIQGTAWVRDLIEKTVSNFPEISGKTE